MVNTGGSIQQELKALTSFENDSKWFYSNFERLRKEYANEFVAVEDQQIIERGKDLEKVLERLRAKGKHTSLIFIKFVPGEEITILY